MAYRKTLHRPWRNFMKREFPILFEKGSVWIATPLAWIAAVAYIQKAFERPTPEAYAVGITAFGITAALSGICFAMAPVCNGDTAIYAGEKFLHTSLLLIQTLMVLYVRDAMLTIEWIRSHSPVVLAMKFAASSVLMLVTIAATWTWHYGLTALNTLLWENWERRIREINSAVKRT
jgi:hypothetical protein